MAIPIRNTVRTAGVKSAYSLSYIQNSAGSTISGEIRQYATYAAMLADPAPTRLASVLNGSYDDNYETTVPQEHWGGVLYQRDEVNSTWILLYNTSDITVPTRVDWEHVVNVPAWVGGVTCNRKKLIQNAYAETRTTYYSYGDYILVLPDPATVKLGDQIVLEQYKGQGAVCYPYASGEESMYLVNIDGTLETSELCHVLYTTADYAYTRDSEGKMVIDSTNPINHHSYMFTCTENELGTRIWRFNANDAVEDTVISLRKEHYTHLRSADPHHMYIKKSEVGKYIKSLVEVQYVLPDAETYRLGGVYLASLNDIASGTIGNRAVTAWSLNQTLGNYAPTSHNHNLATLGDVSGELSAGVVPLYSTEQNKFILTTVTQSGITYDDATVESRGLVKLCTETDIASGSSGAIVPTASTISSVLTGYTKVGVYPSITNLKDVSIATLVDGKILTVRGGAVVLDDYPAATTSSIGCMMIASDAEIVSGTTVTTKAVTPSQVINVSSNIIDEVRDMLINSGYVLPAATSAQIGGVKLISDEVLAIQMSDYPSFSSKIVDEWTAINPRQFASYFYNISSNVYRDTASYVSNYMIVTSQRVTDLSVKVNNVSATADSGLAKANDVSSTLTPIVTSLASSAVIMVQSSIQMVQSDASVAASAVVVGHVLMTYNEGSSQVYPTITYGNGSSIITQNFGAVKTENWTVMCTKTLQ